MAALGAVTRTLALSGEFARRRAPGRHFGRVGEHRRRPPVRPRRCLGQRNRAARPRREMAQGAAHPHPAEQRPRRWRSPFPAATGWRHPAPNATAPSRPISASPPRSGRSARTMRAGLCRPADRGALPQGADPSADHRVAGAAEGAAPGRRSRPAPLPPQHRRRHGGGRRLVSRDRMDRPQARHRRSAS